MLNRHNFKIAELAPKDPELGPPCGILVGPDDTRVTDGHCLVIVTKPKPPEERSLFEVPETEAAQAWTPFVLDRDSALHVAKTIPKSKDRPETQFAMIDVQTESGESCRIVMADLLRQEIVLAKKVEQKFPSFDSVVPDERSAELTVDLDVELLIQVLRQFKSFTPHLPRATFRFRGPNQGIRIDAEIEDQRMTAVVMPMRRKEDIPPEHEEPEVDGQLER